VNAIFQHQPAIRAGDHQGGYRAAAWEDSAVARAKGADPVGCQWRRGAAVWSSLQELGVLPTMQYSVAHSVDFAGTRCIGVSGFFDPVTENFGLRPVRWELAGAITLTDLLPVLQAQFPTRGITTAWVLEATVISSDGRVIAGRATFPRPTAGDPAAVVEEGWTAWVQ
jgi:hypothetical protein